MKKTFKYTEYPTDNKYFNKENKYSIKYFKDIKYEGIELNCRYDTIKLKIDLQLIRKLKMLKLCKNYNATEFKILKLIERSVDITTNNDELNLNGHYNISGYTYSQSSSYPYSHSYFRIYAPYEPTPRISSFEKEQRKNLKNFQQKMFNKKFKNL